VNSALDILHQPFSKKICCGHMNIF